MRHEKRNRQNRHLRMLVSGVIPERFYRGASDLERCQDTGFPTQAFGNDEAFLVNGTAVK